METNISEKLQICRNCKNRKFDKATGLVCGLTDAKPTFEEKCPYYVADETAIEIDREREKDRSGREAGIRGWLAFFIWVGVIGGAVGSVIIGAIALSKNTFGLIYSIICGTQLSVLTLTAVLTCVAFYKKKPNAVSLAKTYIAMIALDGVFYAVICLLTKETVGVQNVFRQVSWAIIWYSFLVKSQAVNELIPLNKREWRITEKVLLAIYATIEILFVGGCIYLTKSENPKNIFYKDDVYLDSSIRATQAALPVDYGDGVLLTGAKKDGAWTVVFEYTLTDVDSRIHDVNAMRENAVTLKYEELSAVKENDDNFTETCARLGRNIKTCYFDKFKTFIGSYSISPEEYYYSKNLASGDWICPKEVLEEQIAKEKATYPIAFSSDSEYINVTLSDDNKELVYEIRFSPMDQSELLTITSADLLDYVNGNWSALATPMRKLAEMDGIIITYRFTTSAGIDFRTVKVDPETYSRL